MTLRQVDKESLEQNIFSILILKWHISFPSMPVLNSYIYKIYKHTHGWQKTCFFNHHHPDARKNVYKRIFCKISVYTRLTELSKTILNRTEENFFYFFNPFWCFLVQRLHSVLWVGLRSQSLILRFTLLCYPCAINTNCPLNIYKLWN